VTAATTGQMAPRCPRPARIADLGLQISLPEGRQPLNLGARSSRLDVRDCLTDPAATETERAGSTLGIVYQLDFADFNETEFEEFCFELLKGLPGFHNVDWRKGTPKPSSPADRGRDIAAEVDHVDVDGARHVETWFVDCKHYERGVPPEAVQGLLTWAQAERPHVALVIASGFLSNAAKDYLRDYEQNNRPPFRIKYWERPTVNELASQDRELLARCFTSGTPWYPTDAEHIMQCELAGCKHPAVYVIEGDRADTVLGWCALCREVARQQEEELAELGARPKRLRKVVEEPS
jgi:hypothetical protein